MPIDCKREELFPLADACKLLPRRNGKRPHLTTAWRWTRKGVRGVKLETVPVGGLLYTSREAIIRFMERLERNRAERNDPLANEPPPRSRRAQIREADRVLDEAGI